MKIAIHHRENSYSEQWIHYCESHEIPYKLVNCYETDIISQMKDCDALMWHWPHWDYKARLFARQLTYSLEKIGKKVFPDSNTAWHYDDKVGQKYLLEAIGNHLVPTTVFYNKPEALKWTSTTDFPVVFKLKNGASSMNVELVKTAGEARKLIRKAFNSGFQNYKSGFNFKDRIREFVRKQDSHHLWEVVKSFGRLWIPSHLEKYSTREKGYIYFQKYIPGNEYDTRVYVFGNKAFAARRFVRKNDFRASGSHHADTDPTQINLECLKIAFQVSKQLNAQCLAFDFVLENQIPLITEISYASSVGVYREFPGFWDDQLQWHPKAFIEEEFMIEQFIESFLQKEH